LRAGAAVEPAPEADRGRFEAVEAAEVDEAEAEEAAARAWNINGSGETTGEIGTDEAVGREAAGELKRV